VRSNHEQFEFRASLGRVDEGLDVLHRSIERLRQSTGRAQDDEKLMLFETALGEIGGNVLTHGRPNGDEEVEYALRFDGRVVVAWLSDLGAPVHEHMNRAMPGVESEAGRGLALARVLLDELAYERDGGVNRWRLVKSL
jgi:serine/threonine-protein kinase RsbW